MTRLFRFRPGVALEQLMTATAVQLHEESWVVSDRLPPGVSPEHFEIECGVAEIDWSPLWHDPPIS